MFQRVKETAKFLHENGITVPEVAIILGTGLGGLIQTIDIIKCIDYENIPGFPVSTVESHHGRLIYGNLAGKRVLAMQGRFHFYEGYSLSEVTFPIRVMKELGVCALLISNACGSINPAFSKGNLMLIDDHINLLPDNPLRGVNIDEQGPRFPDMSQPYHPALAGLFRFVSTSIGIGLYEGIYAAVPGPNLETRAEYRYLRTIGADVVGMSTVPEVIVANHIGLPCAAISVITDECNPDNLKPVSLTEILQAAAEAEPKLNQLMTAVVGQLNLSGL